MKKYLILSAVLATLLAPSIGFLHADTITKSLSVGMSGPEVVILQNYLIKAGILKTSATGYFGSATFAAVKEFQRQNNMPIVGIAGPVTRGLINYALQGAQIGPANTNTTTQASSDVAVVQSYLTDIRQGYLTSNLSLVTKHASAATAQFILSGTLGKVSSFTVNNVFQSGANIIASISSVSEGVSDNENLVFIKESGDWRFDFTATFQYAQQQADAKKSTGNATGSADLVVTGVSISPSHPIANSKDVQINISVKNIGTKTADTVSLEVKIPEFTATPYQIVDFALAPGETVVEKYNPYSNNDFFKVSDTAGQKMLQITVNKDHKVAESNYDNNFFTQILQMYSN